MATTVTIYRLCVDCDMEHGTRTCNFTHLYHLTYWRHRNRGFRWFSENEKQTTKFVKVVYTRFSIPGGHLRTQKDSKLGASFQTALGVLPQTP